MGGTTSALRIDWGGASLRPDAPEPAPPSWAPTPEPPKQTAPQFVPPQRLLERQAQFRRHGAFLEALDHAQIHAQRFRPEDALTWNTWRDIFKENVLRHWREDPAEFQMFIARRNARLECPAWHVGASEQRTSHRAIR